MLRVRMRLSFTQVELLTAPLKSLKPPPIPYPFLLSGALYEAELGKALRKDSPLKVPWHQGFGSWFWRYYAKKDSASPKELWRALTPLFRATTAQINPPVANFTAAARVYFYPWAVAGVVTADSTTDQTLDEAISAAFELQKTGKYKYRIEGKHGEAPLPGLMEALRGSARNEAFGATSGKAGNLFSIASALKAKGADPSKAVPSGGELHQMMEALTGWNQYWKSLKLDDIKHASIEIQTAPEGHVLYGAKRGRFVWFPAGFEYARKLPCYHQNLTMASLQTESLTRLICEAAELIASGKTLADFSITYRNCIQLAAGLLGRLYGGVDTYRSHSVREQIDQSKAQINAVRKLFPQMGGDLALPQ